MEGSGLDFKIWKNKQMARPQAADYDQKRRHILLISERLFAKHNFDRTTTAMIALKCGVSKAVLYHYYSTKTDILFAILHERYTRLSDIVVRNSAGVDEPIDRLKAIAVDVLDELRRTHAQNHVVATDSHLLANAQQRKLKMIERNIIDRVAAVMREALPGVAQMLVKPLTLSLFAMLTGHYLWYREGGALSRDEYARLAVDLIVTGAGQSKPTL